MEGDIVTATLRLNAVGACGPTDVSAPISTHRAIAEWTETAVTWNTRPGYADAYGGQSIAHDGRGWYEFDVADLVRAWHDGTYVNHGVMIIGPASSRRSFSAREGSFVPELVVGLMTPSITTTPTPIDTPALTNTPAITSTPTLTSTTTPVDTNTPTPTETPTAIVSPAPTATTDMTVTPEPTRTPSTSGIYLPIVVNHP